MDDEQTLSDITKLQPGTLIPDWYNVDLVIQALSRRVLVLDAAVAELREEITKLKQKESD